MVLHTFTATVKKEHFSIYVNFTAVINSMVIAGFEYQILSDILKI